MSFQVGDCVVHPAHGVGHVVKMEKKKFFGNKERLYYEVNTDKCTVWVPVEDYEELGLRPLTPKTNLAQYRDVLKAAPNELDPDYRSRHAAVVGQLKEGSFQDLCEVVRDLTALSWEKPLNESDSTTLQKAYDNLCAEWAVASGLTLPDAIQEIEALLQDAQRIYAGT
jgi:CarD family transcriptional regulator